MKWACWLLVLCLPAWSEEFSVPLGHAKGAGWSVFRGDGARLFTQGVEDGRVKVWDPHVWSLLESFAVPQTEAHLVAATNTEALFVVEGEETDLPQRLAESRLLRRDLHSGKVRGVSGCRATPDGQHLLALLPGGRMSVLSLEGKALGSIPLRAGDREVYVSPSGRQAAVAGSGVRTYSLPSGQPGPTLNGLAPVGFSHDGKRIATFGEDPDWQPVDDGGPMTEAAFSHSLTLRCWNAVSGRQLWTQPNFGYQNYSTHTARQLCFSADDRRLLVLEDGELAVLDSGSGRRRGGQSMVTGSPLPLAFHRDTVVSGDGEVFSLSRNAVVAHLPAAPGELLDARFSADGSRLVVSDEGRSEVRCWDLQALTSQAWQTPATLRVGFTERGVWAGQRQRVQLFEPMRGSPLETLLVPGADPASPDPDGLVLLPPQPGRFHCTRKSNNDPLVIHDHQTGTTLEVSVAAGDEDRAVWSMDGTRLAYSVTSNYELELGSGRSRCISNQGSSGAFHFLGEAAAMAWSPDGTRLATWDGAGLVVADTTTAQPLVEVPHSAVEPHRAAWSANGEVIALGGGGEVDTYTSSGQPLAHLEGLAPDGGDALALSPDGRLVACGNGGVLELRDARSGTLRASLLGFGARAWVIYTPGGDYVSSGWQRAGLAASPEAVARALR